MLWDTLTNKFIRVIERNSARMPSEQQVIEHEIARVKTSMEWRWMLDGVNYFQGRQDIDGKQRMAIGEGGVPEAVTNVVNNRVTDNVYRTMVKQKVNYLLGKPFAVTSDNSTYQAQLQDIFDARFMQKLKAVGADSLNCGIGWLYVHYDEQGNLCFRRFRPYEIIPEWKDDDHTELESVIRFYNLQVFDGQTDKLVQRVEVYTLNGVDYYETYPGNMILSAPPYHTDYIHIGNQSYNWNQLPFIAFKRDSEELPLIVHCKSLQDGLNRILSNFEDNIEDDPRQTIMVLVNYDGQDLGEFRHNLATYGAVKVRSDANGVGGDVKTLSVEVNAENYKAIADIFRKAIIRNCMGYDAKDERSSGTPNEMNIRSMYSDIDLDAKDMETEFQQSMSRLIDFIDLHLINSGLGDFRQEKYRITFNKDMPMDEAATISSIQQSVGILSQRTLLAHHPWVDDVDSELEQLKKDKEEELTQQYDPFAQGGGMNGQTDPQQTNG